MFVQKCQVILNKGFVLLWTNSPRLHQAYSLESWLTGTVFKILDARQSEIHHQFTRNISLNLCKNIRKLFKRLKRFQILLWAWSRGNRRAFLTYFCRSPCHRRIVKSLAFASRNCSVTPEVEGHSSAESTNFTLFISQRNVSGGYLLRLQTLYNFTSKSSRLSRCQERFSWKYTENFRLPGI